MKSFFLLLRPKSYPWACSDLKESGSLRKRKFVAGLQGSWGWNVADAGGRGADLSQKLQTAFQDAVSAADVTSRTLARRLQLRLPSKAPHPDKKAMKRLHSGSPVPERLLGEVQNEILQLSWRTARIDPTAPQASISRRLVQSGHFPNEEAGGAAVMLKYMEDARDLEPRCHWGQMKLLASEWDFCSKPGKSWVHHVAWWWYMWALQMACTSQSLLTCSQR